jgi:hypothetical protein
VRPAAMVSRIPHAVLAGSALIRSMNFLEIAYSFLKSESQNKGGHRYP